MLLWIYLNLINIRHYRVTCNASNPFCTIRKYCLNDEETYIEKSDSIAELTNKTAQAKCCIITKEFDLDFTTRY